ncbi:MAG: malectin domain-containing carbohydrate-binding protein, partial [Deltaproteobacteria bacterium]|nr:malectin domain-containing carbohydrate-binding protein [Deltaproteobacteria bacterium]
MKVEGREVISNLDLVAKAGKNRAFDFMTPVTVTDGKLTVEFYSTGNNAKVNAILVTSNQPVSQFTMTATAGAGGTISPSGGVNVVAGSDQTFTITPNSGYRIADVKVDGVTVGAITSKTFTNVTSNHTIEASFTATTTYSLSIAKNG